MNVSSLYSSKPFYDSTSALNGNPFVNPRTCGVSGTMRGCTLSANPAFGNIGYANRISGTGDIVDTLVSGAKTVLGKVSDVLAPTVTSVASTLLSKELKALREAAGYQFLETVQINYQGKLVSGTKAKKPDNSFVVVLSDGTEIPYTSDVARTVQTISPQTGLSSGATTGLIVGAVALGALFLFMSKRRR